ncbi:MAG: acetyl-coenzyme A synthetase N-terminal domain-containing protein, partial [Myxococcota bacterium]|nr:acetyl-coenzyme A synthetase N-terminal domain-containing protein [Myxococcota bacterium]
MSDLHAVPERVREGSPNPIREMSAYRDQAARAQVDPDAFWLGITRSLVHWSEPPTVGLSGSFHDIASAPIRWFED